MGGLTSMVFSAPGTQLTQIKFYTSRHYNVCLKNDDAVWFPEDQFVDAAENWSSRRTGGYYSVKPYDYTYRNQSCSKGLHGTKFSFAPYKKNYRFDGTTYKAKYYTR